MWQGVFKVTSHAPVTEAGRLMGDMRMWLDKRRVIPVAFHCNDSRSAVEIEVGFAKEVDAKAFAHEFAVALAGDGAPADGRH